MSEHNLEGMLADGWDIAGYAVCMTVLGSLMHNVLLRKGTHLVSINVVMDKGREIARAPTVLTTPPPEAPRRGGLFG